MSYILVDENKKEWLVDDQIMIGRGRDCDIKVDDPLVSRVQFTIWLQNDRLYLRDHASSNGTWVNGRQVQEEVQLNPGDVIKFGDSTFQIQPFVEAATVMARDRQAPSQPQPQPVRVAEHIQTPTPKEKKGAKNWLVFGGVGGILLLGLCLILAIAAYFIYRANSSGSPDAASQRESTPVLALALRTDGGQPLLTAYAGYPESDPLWLSEGEYYIEAFDQNQNVLRMANSTIANVSEGGDIFQFPSDFTTDGYQDERHVQDLYTIVNFLINLDRARLTYFQIISDKYQATLYAMPGDVDLEQLDQLYTMYNEILAEEQVVTAALEAFEWRSTTFSSSGHMARPSQGFIGSFLDFFGFAGKAGSRASEDILKAAATMTQKQRDEAFTIVTGGLVNNAANFDEMLDMLENGELDNSAAQIRKNLMTDIVFAGAIQDVHGSNRPGLAIAHQEGSQLVTKGANLNIDIIKTVLGDHFAGIDQGLDYADKLDQWAQFTNDFYNDPTKAVQGYAEGEIKSALIDRIKDDLISSGISEDIAGEFSDMLGNQVWTEIKDNLKGDEEEKEPPPNEEEQPQAQPDPEPAVNDDYRNFAGTWNSGKKCDEPEENYAYTWVIILNQSAEWVTGTLAYHDCPGGGRAFYELEGEATSDKKIILGATLVGGRGELYSTATSYFALNIKHEGKVPSMPPAD